ncbi:hypothetical protein [Rahnella inusitata]|uniref:hypothetical protein n=1 Tax=Rahnella inusitata TaxID=58169 RepID=UPI0039B09277
MKCEYKISGVLASLTITSTVFEFRKHNRIVDAVLLSPAAVRAKRTGFFLMTSVISGRTPAVMRAYKVAQREYAR